MLVLLSHDTGGHGSTRTLYHKADPKQLTLGTQLTNPVQPPYSVRNWDKGGSHTSEPDTAHALLLKGAGTEADDTQRILYGDLHGDAHNVNGAVPYAYIMNDK
jgi:hypothetical protein